MSVLRFATVRDILEEKLKMGESIWTGKKQLWL